MADYKTLHGTNIETVSSDPSNPINGQVWYNSTDQKVKGFTSNPAGSWAEGNNLNTARQRHAAAGTQTAALGFGGKNASDSQTDVTEKYLERARCTWTNPRDWGYVPPSQFN